jgi:hypothetical protein
MNEHQTPLQEAISLITILAVLLGVGCYVAALRNLPLLSPTLLAVARFIYGWLPALNGVHVAQMPMVVSAAAVAGAFWILSVPFAGLLANVFSAGQLASIERQTDKLKRNRARIQKGRRDRDSFEVI